MSIYRAPWLTPVDHGAIVLFMEDTTGILLAISVGSDLSPHTKGTRDMAIMLSHWCKVTGTEEPTLKDEFREHVFSSSGALELEASVPYKRITIDRFRPSAYYGRLHDTHVTIVCMPTGLQDAKGRDVWMDDGGCVFVVDCRPARGPLSDPYGMLPGPQSYVALVCPDGTPDDYRQPLRPLL